MINFRQPIWIIAFGHLLGMFCIGIGVYSVIFDIAEFYWLLLWPLMHTMSSLMLSVGLHRYFSHGTFKTSVFWHKFMAYYSTILLQGSALGWSTAHITHHIHSDTERDPHIASASYLIWKRYRNVPMTQGRLKYLINDPTLKFIHRYGQLLWLGFVVILLTISWKLFIFGYGMALGSTHLVGAFHTTLTHLGKTPRNYPILEYVLPASGEWMHKTHHENSRAKDFSTKWWHLDTGALFIKLIEIK